MTELTRQVTGFGPVRPGGIVIVGESPSDMDVAQGKPFVGPAGIELRKRIAVAGLKEEGIRFENVIEYKIPNNDIGAFYLDKKRTIPGKALQRWFDDCRKRIAALNAGVVIATGETALQACTGLSGINGLHCTVGKGIQEINCPVIPILHPSYILRQPGEGVWIIIGLKKAQRLLRGERDLERTLRTSPSWGEVNAYFDKCETTEEISVDIESTITTSEITCVGLATSPTDAMCIPFSVRGGSYWSEDNEGHLWKRLARLLRSPGKRFIYQNFIFESLMFSKRGIELSRHLYDTMAVAQVLQPELKKGLGSLAKIYTLAEAWKEEHDWSAKVNPEELWIYNAKDAAITFQVAEMQRKEMAFRNLTSFYDKYVKPLYEPVYEMCARGWNIDKAALAQAETQLEAQIADVTEKVKAASRQFNPDFNPNSPKQLKDLLRNMGIEIPVDNGKETTDRLAMLKIARKYPKLEFIQPYLERQKAQKLYSTYAKVKIDDDNRLRFTIIIPGTKSGRWSSSQTPWETGLNSQNVPSRDRFSKYNFRQVVVPDKDCTLFSVDLKNADARVVAWLSKEEKMIHAFGCGSDVYSMTANGIFNQDIRLLPEEERKQKRYLGKKCTLAFMYRMKENTFIDSCLLESDLQVSYNEAKIYRNGYFRSWPRIEAWQKLVREEVFKTRKLTTPFGRERYFHGRLDDMLWNEACSYIPQSTVADAVNQALIYIHKESNGFLEILGQCHDSLLLQCKTMMFAEAIKLIKIAFDSVKLRIHGIERVIPYDISYGENWRDLVPFVG